MGIVLGLKLVLVPSLIAGVTWVGRRWGPAVAGWLSAFPIVSAPILFFFALEHGSTFTANAAIGTLSSVLANVLFGVCYAWGAVRFSWYFSVLFGFIGYFATVAALSILKPTLGSAIMVVLTALLLAPYLYPTLAPPPVAHSVNPGNDIWLRMAAGAALVLLVTHFSSELGPHLSGLFAMFPVMGSVLAVFSHRQSGAGFAIKLLRGMLLGYYAFSMFCIALSLALPVTSIGGAFALALACALVVQAVSRTVIQRALPK